MLVTVNSEDGEDGEEQLEPSWEDKALHGISHRGTDHGSTATDRNQDLPH